MRSIRVMGPKSALHDLQSAATDAGFSASIGPAFRPAPGVPVNVAEVLEIVLSHETAEILVALAAVLYQVRQMRRGRHLTFMMKDGDRVVAMDADRLTTDQMSTALGGCNEMAMIDTKNAEQGDAPNERPA